MEESDTYGSDFLRYLRKINASGMENNTAVTVEFKEKYMPEPVTRTCVNMTKEEVVKVYGLEEPDIEWFRFY